MVVCVIQVFRPVRSHAFPLHAEPWQSQVFEGVEFHDSASSDACRSTVSARLIWQMCFYRTDVRNRIPAELFYRPSDAPL